MRFILQISLFFSLIFALGGLTRAPAAVVGSGQLFTSLIETPAGILGVDSSGVWISTDNGASFNSVYSDPDQTFDALAASGNTVAAVGEAGLVIRSTNGGVDWAEVATPGLFGDLISVATDGNGNWLATGDASGAFLFRSIDDGENWSEISAPVAMRLRAIAWQADAGWILAGEGSFIDGVVYRSTDNGASWQLLADDLPAPINAVAINSAGEILLAGESGLLLQGSTVTPFQTPAGYSPISEDFFTATATSSAAFIVGGAAGALWQIDDASASDLSLGGDPDINSLLVLANNDLLISGTYEPSLPQERSIPFELILSRDAVSGDFVLTVQETLTDRSYRIESSSDLQSWTEVVGSERPGNGAAQVWTFPGDGPRLFWRAVEF